MSYSFSIKRATKPEVESALAAEFDRVVSGQPVHAKDRLHAEDAARQILNALPDVDASKVYELRVHGSVSLDAWPDGNVTSVSVGVTANIIPA